MLAWAIGTGGAVAAGLPQREAAAVGLIRVRLGGDATTTRLVLDLDAPIKPKVVLADVDAGRLIIALPRLLSSGPMRGAGRGAIGGWAILDDSGGERLSLDLSPGATVSHGFVIPPSSQGDHWRYVIDVSVGDPVAALVAAAGALPPPKSAAPLPTPGVLVVSAATRPAPVDATRAVATHRTPVTPPRPPTTAYASGAKPGAALAKVVVIDAGHGGHDPGARSLVRNEKDINLAAALTLKARLESLGGYRVVLTRDSDVFIPLETRVQIARSAGADLFISLHADSAGTDPTPHGASVYTLSDHGQTRVNTVLGAHEWFARAGDTSHDPGVRQLLLDLTQRSTRNRSARFANLLINHIGDRVDLLPRTHRDARYFVLLAPDVPAVLLEMGFITNPGDEMRLTDPAQRERLMAGVAAAIDGYFHGETRLAASL
jgi:N-acetylmuramoyl-L-alanine amidase